MGIGLSSKTDCSENCKMPKDEHLGYIQIWNECLRKNGLESA